jgi:hypothetical protein
VIEMNEARTDRAAPLPPPSPLAVLLRRPAAVFFAGAVAGMAALILVLAMLGTRPDGLDEGGPARVRCAAPSGIQSPR